MTLLLLTASFILGFMTGRLLTTKTLEPEIRKALEDEAQSMQKASGFQ